MVMVIGLVMVIGEVMVMVMLMVMLRVTVMMFIMRSKSGIFQTHLLHVDVTTLCGRNAWLQVQQERHQVTHAQKSPTGVMISEQFAAT